MKTASVRKNTRKGKAKSRTAETKKTATAPQGTTTTEKSDDKKNVVGLSAVVAQKVAEFKKAIAVSQKFDIDSIVEAKNQEDFSSDNKKFTPTMTAVRDFLLWELVKGTWELKSNVPYLPLFNLCKAIEKQFNVKGIVSSGCSQKSSKGLYKFLTALYNTRTTYKKGKRGTKYMYSPTFVTSKNAEGDNDNYSGTTGYLIISNKFLAQAKKIMRDFDAKKFPSSCTPLVKLFE